MPNHMHGIVWIVGQDFVGATGRSPRREKETSPIPSGPAPKSLGAFIAGFKSSATKRINLMQQTPGSPVWQRNYHERIIRNDDQLARVRQYIVENPACWEQ